MAERKYDPDISLNIFNHNDSDCTGYPNVIEGCKSLSRLIAAISYYQNLNVMNNDNDRENFSNFIMNIYNRENDNRFLNDYNHLVSNRHRNDLEEIHNLLQNNKQYNNIKCDGIKNCSKSVRHNDRKYNKHNDNNDNILQFYIQTMDSLHFYLGHLYDSGFRVTSSSESNLNSRGRATNNDDDDLIDHEFCRISKAIREKKRNTDKFDRFTSKKFDFIAKIAGK